MIFVLIAVLILGVIGYRLFTEARRKAPEDATALEVFKTRQMLSNVIFLLVGLAIVVAVMTSWNNSSDKARDDVRSAPVGVAVSEL